VPIAAVKGQNHLFHSIPDAEWKKLLPHIEAVDFPLGMVLCEPGMKMPYVYFPSTAIVSILHELENGSSSEVAIVGNEGLLGFSIFLGGGTTSSTAIVKIAGSGYRIKSSIVLQEFNQSAALMHLFLRFTQAIITQMTQTAVCNRHHRMDEQLCRLLLATLDRLPSNEIVMTQELIARSLGVRREGITEGACDLASEGLIKYARGRIAVLDRSGLEDRVCECYRIVKSEYTRLLPECIAA
jgi:CRP-like cAMP-binding protein